MKEMPKFKFKLTVTEQDMQKAEQETKVSVGKVFQPGQYDLKITEFVHHTSANNPNGVSKTDPTWLVYKVVLGGIDTRSISTFILVPTKDLLFNSPKYPKLMATKFRAFLNAVGLPSHTDQIENVVNYLTHEPGDMVGRDVTATIGYTGNYIRYNKDERTFSLVNRKGVEILEGTTFADRDAAIAQAMELGLELKSFPEVTRFIAKTVEAPAQTGTDKW